MGDDTVIDAELDSLPRVLDAGAMREVLARVCAARGDAATSIRSLEVEVLRRRLKRCVVRFHLELERGGGPPVALRVIGKVFRAGLGEPIHAKLRGLWERGFDRRARDLVRVPEPLAFLPELRLLLLEEVPGRGLRDVLTETRSPELLRRLARVLIKLHRVRPWPGPAFRMRGHLERFHPKYPALCEALPDLAGTIESIVRTAQERESGFDPAGFAAIHGDLHLSQVLIDGEQSYLIDLDNLSLGDPAADLANLLVFLRSSRPGREEPVLVSHLLDEYFGAMDARIRERIPVYEAVTQLRRACKDLRFRRPGWEPRARERIAQAAACLRAPSA